jgi:hypothetical protein
MASNIGDIRNGIPPRVQDDANKLSSVAGNGAVDLTKDVDAAIFAALEKYGKDRPRERVSRIGGAGTFKYAVSLLTGFIDGSSSVVAVAYPHLTTDQNLAWLDDDEFGLVRDNSGLYLWFASASPTASEFFLVVYTTPHTLDTTTSTVPAGDDEALKDLAAAECHDMLAAFYSKSTDDSIMADTVHHLSKAAEHRANAKRYRESYAAKLGGNQPTLAAFAMADLDNTFGDQARTDRFFHGRRRF